MLSKLYAITDHALIQDSLTEDIAAAISGGAKMIQLREKSILPELYIEYAKEALSVCRALGAKLIINDSIEVCQAVGADGVHLGQSDAKAEQARSILGDNAIIGVTAKTIEQAIDAAKASANYIGSGAVFGTTTKNDAKKMNIETLKSIVLASPIPVYAIGGINRSNVSKLKDSGIYGIAVVSGVFCGNITENAKFLARVVNEF